MVKVWFCSKTIVMVTIVLIFLFLNHGQFSEGINSLSVSEESKHMVNLYVL